MELKEELTMLADMQPCKSVEEVKEQMAQRKKVGFRTRWRMQSKHCGVTRYCMVLSV